MEAESIDDVPVNRITSFHGRLSQFICPAASDASSNATPCLKRKPAGADNAGMEDAESRLLRAPAEVKRCKRSVAVATDNISYLTTRITRARSSPSPSTTPTAPLSTRSAAPTARKGRGRARQRDSTPTASLSTSKEPLNLLRDVIPPNLVLLLVGVNPGIMTGATGFAYAHPSNRFWKLLYSSGITSVLHPPSDTYRLPELYSVGNTNIVSRPTRDASMLTKAEMDAGVPVLEAKVAAQRPESVCLVGKGIWEAVWRVRKGRAIRKEEFRYGWQDECENMGRVDGSEGWPGAPVFVATTTSGLAATMSMEEKEKVWGELGRWVVRRREERARARVADTTDISDTLPEGVDVNIR